jgi:putative toxin-antitoxin system toxin component, PIN family
MKVILDTNVLVSGIFFKGPPYRIFQIWKKDQITIVISHEILEEYRRVIKDLSVQFPQIDISNLFETITLKAHLTLSLTLHPQICDDPDDDKFFFAALASKTSIIISGDKHLLDKSGFSGITVLKPKYFLDLYFSLE